MYAFATVVSLPATPARHPVPPVYLVPTVRSAGESGGEEGVLRAAAAVEAFVDVFSSGETTRARTRSVPRAPKVRRILPPSEEVRAALRARVQNHRARNGGDGSAHSRRSPPPAPRVRRVLPLTAGAAAAIGLMAAADACDIDELPWPRYTA